MMVSVIMIVYNHSKYIQQAIESILMQETSFDFELIISNDCSTDDSETIIRQTISQNSNGNKVKYFNQEKNLGMMPNFIFALNEGFGKYVALCDGDDYWTDSLKLQKQVDFMEKNPDFSICFHNVNIETDQVLTEDDPKKKIQNVFGLKELAVRNMIRTVSVLYRNGLIDPFPDYFKNAPIGDYFLHLLNAKHGKIKYMDEIMAVYRIHNTSCWSSKKGLEQDELMIHFFENIKENFEPKIQKIFSKQIHKMQHRNKGFLIKNFYKIKRFFI